MKDGYNNYGKSHGQKMMEKLENGGKCSLYDAIQLMHKIFESQRIFGELAIQLLRPMDMDLFEYIVFNICFKMVKMGKSAEQMFTFIDESCDGAITEDEFVNGVREDLGLWLTDTDLVTVFQKVDLDGTGMLDKKEFMQVLNLDSFFKKKESSVYVSNKREMLDAVIGTFDDIQRRDGVYVYKFFTETSNSSTVMNEETMLTSLKDLAEGTEVSDEIFQLVIDDAKKLSQVPHGIDNQGYTRAVLKWNLGNWGYGPIGEYFEEERIQLLSVHEERYMAYKNPQPM